MAAKLSAPPAARTLDLADDTMAWGLVAVEVITRKSSIHKNPRTGTGLVNQYSVQKHLRREGEPHT